MTSRHLPRWLALLLSMAVLAAACGGSDEGTEGETATDQTVEAESFDDQAAEEQSRTGDEEEALAEAAPGEVQTGGTLIISGPSDIADLDAMLEEQLSIVDPAERAEKIKDIQRYALESVLNPIPVWTYFTQWSYSPRVQNFYRHASYGFAGIERVWLSE